jgi:hypothetical protein
MLACECAASQGRAPARHVCLVLTTLVDAHVLLSVQEDAGSSKQDEGRAELLAAQELIVSLKAELREYGWVGMLGTLGAQARAHTSTPSISPPTARNHLLVSPFSAGSVHCSSMIGTWLVLRLKKALTKTKRQRNMAIGECNHRKLEVDILKSTSRALEVGVHGCRCAHGCTREMPTVPCTWPVSTHQR